MLKVRARAAVKAPEKTLNVVLAGNPNAGKTTLFNALTHSRLRTGNFHGVTTSPASKTSGGVTYTDVPGMYSFNSYTMEEDSAATACKSADIIINGVAAIKLRSIPDQARPFKAARRLAERRKTGGVSRCSRIGLPC